MFYSSSAFNQDLSGWDTYRVVSMFRMFMRASAFDHDISNWQGFAASNAQGQMFSLATAFQAKFICSNADAGPLTSCFDPEYVLLDESFSEAISSCLAESPKDGLCTEYGLKTKKYGTMPNWDTSRITRMVGHDGNGFVGFAQEQEFNGDISKWNTSQVTTMRSMFWEAAKFNQDIGKWDTAKVTDMHQIFRNTAFNRDIGEWNTAQVTDMSRMFRQAVNFNQYIGDWNTLQVTNMKDMFYEARSFDQNIGSWNISKVENMNSMFYKAYSFTQDVSKWDDSSVTDSVDLFGDIVTFFLRFSCPVDGPASTCVDKTPESPTLVTDDNFYSAIETCLTMDDKAYAENGMCYASEYGAMQYWDTSRVTDMRGWVGRLYVGFGNRVSFNANISSWDTSQVMIKF